VLVPTIPPDWVQDAIFYQVFPDRFRNGDPRNDPPDVRPWGAPPGHGTFCGGDLAGIREKLPYLLELGVNALYLNPILSSPSTHHYDTHDYFQVDPRLGDLDSFRQLVGQAHAHGVRIILDGVFNHCGRGFFAFQDVLRNGPTSPYADWFHIQSFPLNAYEEHLPAGYLGWWNLRSLPKLNTANPAVRAYVFSIARYWLEQGADGWRLDVPNEIDDDAFWRDFRAIVKETNPAAYIVGEIWNDGSRWLQGDQFDGITHYELRTLLLEWLVDSKYRSLAFAHRIQTLLERYRPEMLHAQLTTLGSHDTVRLVTAAHGDLRTVRLLWLFLLTWPGAPCIYYGDEVGMSGGGDPECRGCFPWDESTWNHDLRALLKKLIALRQERPALRRGKTRILLSHPHHNLYAHGRGEGDGAVVLVLNAGDQPYTVDVPLTGMEIAPGTVFADLLRGGAYLVRSGRIEALSLPARSGTILGTEC
jgi:cyclomaltodextrinase